MSKLIFSGYIGQKRTRKIQEYAERFNANIETLSERDRSDFLDKLRKEDLLHIAGYLAGNPTYKNTQPVPDPVRYVCWLAHWMTFGDDCSWIDQDKWKQITNFQHDLENSSKCVSEPTKYQNPTSVIPEGSLGGGFNEHMARKYPK